MNECLIYNILALTYFPAFDCSIIGGARLDFSVRDGKRCATRPIGAMKLFIISLGNVAGDFLIFSFLYFSCIYYFQIN